MKVELLSFENDLAEFELYNGDEVVTCIADMTNNDLQDFLNGELNIEPHSWYDSEGYLMENPEWFERKDLKLLNEAFEIGYKDICEGMIDDQGGV